MPSDNRSIRSVVPVPPPDSQVSPLNTPSPPCPPLYAHCSIVRGKGKGGPTGGLKVLAVNNGEKGGTRGDTGRLKGGKRAIAKVYRAIDKMNDKPIFRRLFEGSPVVSALTDAELATARTSANAAVNPPPPTAAKLSCWLCGAATLPSPGGLCVRCEVRRLST